MNMRRSAEHDGLVAHKHDVVRRASENVEPDVNTTTMAFMADVMGGVLSLAEHTAARAPVRREMSAT